VLYPHTIEDSLKFSRQAIQRLEKEQLPFTPDIYQLWYIYYAGLDLGLKKVIDEAVGEGKKIDQNYCRLIFENFVSGQKMEEKVKEAGDRLNSTIANVTGVVRSIKDTTNKYNGSLMTLSDRLIACQTVESVREAVQDLMSNTGRMISASQTLEGQLERSTQEILRLRKDLEVVRKEALTDSLTVLANRKAFDQEIRNLCKQAEENGLPFSLIMMDIDHFKSFNDNYGHQVGDQVLRLVAKCLTDGVKGQDMAARYGGEEFAILLPETNLNASVIVANNLRKAVAQKDVVNRATGEKLGRITLSGGVAQFYPGEKPEDIIERADSALYTAKHNGRNQVAAAPTPYKLKV